MKMSMLLGRRIKEDPKDAKVVSHKFLVRGGYVRSVSAGIYSLLPVGKRIVDKIERIIRQEMNAIDGQEVLMPVVLPADLWQESGVRQWPLSARPFRRWWPSPSSQHYLAN